MVIKGPDCKLYLRSTNSGYNPTQIYMEIRDGGFTCQFYNDLYHISDCIVYDPVSDTPLPDAVQEYIFRWFEHAAVGMSIRQKFTGYASNPMAGTSYGFTPGQMLWKKNGVLDLNAGMTLVNGRVMAIIDGFNDTLRVHVTRQASYGLNGDQITNEGDWKMNLVWLDHWYQKPPLPSVLRSGTRLADLQLPIVPVPRPINTRARRAPYRRQ